MTSALLPVWRESTLPVPAPLLEDLAPLAQTVPPELAALLDEPETEALRRRVRQLLEEPVLPLDPTGCRVPWPLL